MAAKGHPTHSSPCLAAICFPACWVGKVGRQGGRKPRSSQGADQQGRMMSDERRNPWAQTPDPGRSAQVTNDCVGVIQRKGLANRGRAITICRLPRGGAAGMQHPCMRCGPGKRGLMRCVCLVVHVLSAPAGPLQKPLQPNRVKLGEGRGYVHIGLRRLVSLSRRRVSVGVCRARKGRDSGGAFFFCLVLSAGWSPSPRER